MIFVVKYDLFRLSFEYQLFVMLYSYLVGGKGKVNFCAILKLVGVPFQTGKITCVSPAAER